MLYNCYNYIYTKPITVRSVFTESESVQLPTTPLHQLVRLAQHLYPI